MENARQYHEDRNAFHADPETDTAARRKYFDYVSYGRHINTADADPALAHDQFYTDIPPANFSLSQPATGLLSETHESNKAGVQQLIVQGTRPHLRISPEPYDVATDASSGVTTDERRDRKRCPSQTSSEGEPPAKKHKHVKGIFHPDEHDWLVLFHEKIRAAAETGCHIKLSGPGPITHAFNSSFGGCILKDGFGQDLPPREDRMELSIRNKIIKPNTKIWELRDATRKLLYGKRGGEVYVPEVSEEELRQYRADGTMS